ncbi:MAG: hypothetical protein HOD43_11950 [Candidatus Marinimicrobia bacterium]|jgi:hypothetical protein|nr:hypothetical protein [Candidatus Neomarinimicrobiota bacterium]MBT3631776.1 hypothetical protein [Candidatus Neomarinimicrobiota bacterium]MBT3825500.1 hypothetical protein [Candidatus Neomarinimicrobiota bacterium]MBT4132227.1 hypothetical protein [Candidatus Neomarinimicrobiota bacterium]MBT4296501.1 hypothetical protein [Candidatus Neomarinimicrobiota bacterium]
MQNLNIISSNYAKTDPESGFGVTLIAVTIAVIMGLAVSVYMRQVSTQALEFQDMYSSSQARWSSLSGIEFGLYKAELGEADVSGTYSFFNSLITLDTLETYTGGGALPDFLYMVTSRGVFGESYIDLRFLSKKSLKAIWGDVSVIEGTDDVDIQNTYTLNDSLYIGQDVTVESGTPLGDPANGVGTHLYTPPGTAVSPATGTYYTSGVHAREWLFSPDFNTTPYDSMLDIAYGLSSSTTWRINGSERYRNVTIDLNDSPDSTLYANGKLTFSGCTITGGDTTRPAVIVATMDIIAENRNGVETTFGDNVVLIADDDIYLYDATEFGLDWSGLSPENRPNTFNMMYGFDYIVIDDGVEAWSSTFSADDIRVDGKSYGIVYAQDKFTIKEPTSYLEGAIFAVKVVGANGANRLDRGTMNLNHYFNQDFFKTFDYGVINQSLLEF